MASPEYDVRKLQVSLALAAKELLGCEEMRGDKISTMPFQLAESLGYEGGHDDYDKLRDFLSAFWKNNQGSSI